MGRSWIQKEEDILGGRACVAADVLGRVVEGGGDHVNEWGVQVAEATSDVPKTEDRVAANALVAVGG
jgi:hypothetical protein